MGRSAQTPLRCPWCLGEAPAWPRRPFEPSSQLGGEALSGAGIRIPQPIKYRAIPPDQERYRKVGNNPRQGSEQPVGGLDDHMAWQVCTGELGSP